MINVTKSFKNDCGDSQVTLREYIILKGTNTKIDIQGNLYSSAYSETHYVGTFNLNYLKFKAENDIDYKKKEFEYYREINGTSIKIGSYIVTEVEDSDTFEEVNVTAFDYGLKFAIPYETKLDYPGGKVKLMDVLQECCTKCGVALKNTSIPNGNFIVDSNQFMNNPDITYGDVISAIAQINGYFARVDEEDKLELLFKEETDEIIEDYEELEDKRDTRPITAIRMGLSSVEGEEIERRDEQLIAKYGLHFLEINDNPFAYTETKRNQLIDAIFNVVKGFGYSSFVAKYAFKPYMQVGDIVKLRAKDGSLINSIVLRMENVFDDYTLEAPSVTDANIKYKQPMDVRKAMKRAEIKVDQALAEVTSVSQAIYGNGGILQEMTIVKQSVNNVEIKAESIGTTNLLKYTALPKEHEKDAFTIRNDNNPEAETTASIVDLKKDTYNNCNSLEVRFNHKSGAFIPEKYNPIEFKTYKDLENGKNLCLSFNILAPALGGLPSTEISFIVYFEDFAIKEYIEGQEPKVIYQKEVKIQLEENKWKQVKIPFGEIVNVLDDAKENTISIRIPDQDTTHFDINNMMLEYGLIPTQWSKAPQDTNELVDKNNIVASLNVGVADGQGVVSFKGDAVEISTNDDRFHLTKEGNIKASEGEVAGLTMSHYQKASYLNKNFLIDGVEHQSGIYIPDKEVENAQYKPFIYAGCNLNETLDKSNLVIQHNGLVKAKWFKVNGESGFFYVNFDSGNSALLFDKNGIQSHLDNETHNRFASFQFVRANGDTNIELYDSTSFSIYDSVHGSTLATFVRQDGSSTFPQAHTILFNKLYNYHDGKSNYIVNSDNVEEIAHKDNGKTYLEYSGYFGAYGCDSWPSDKRIKKDITDTNESGLDFVRKLKHKDFKWKENNKEVKIGYIAQDLKELDENLVFEIEQPKESDNYKKLHIDKLMQIDKSALIPYLSKAIQELDNKVQEQDKKINELYDIIEEQREMIQKLIEKEK